MRALFATSLALALTFTTACNCGGAKLIAAACQDDQQCGQGQLCENYRCVEASTKACDVVTHGNPILQPAPYAVSFGKTDVAQAQQTVELHNIGNCTLTLYEAKLSGDAASPFSCGFCDEPFPLEIFPGRHRDFAVDFLAKGVGEANDRIRILSDDREFGQLDVPLHVNYLGTPELKVAPNPIDFGYVAQGRQARRQIRITNPGTGVAELKILGISLPASNVDFSLSVAFAGPVTLKPLSTNPDSMILLDVDYHPRSTAKHATALSIQTDKGTSDIPVAGNAETPPKLVFNPAMLDLGKVPLGRTNLQRLTLSNEGGAPLNVTYIWGGPKLTTDLYATPLAIPDIAAGNYTEVQIAFTATAVGVVNGLLVLSSNDPSRPSVTIPVVAEGVPGPGPEVVKMEMTFENGTDGVFDKDIRNVDLTLEHPYGYVCNKQSPSPMNWGNYGTPTWISFAPKEEPERIVLADAQADGTYRAMVTYMQDCKSLPSDLLAGLLGISIDALVLYLSGGVVPLDPKTVADTISKICLDHSSTSAMVRVYVNGTIVKEKTVTLGRTGDTLYPLTLVRANGAFTVQ